MEESSSNELKTLWEIGEIARYEQFLAPLAEGQRAIVMALCPSCVRPSARSSVRACVRKLFL